MKLPCCVLKILWALFLAFQHSSLEYSSLVATAQLYEDVEKWPKPIHTFRIGERLPYDDKHVGISSSVRRDRISLKTSFLSLSRPPRVLFVINMFSWIHWDAIDVLFESYRDICEGGWDIKVVVLTAAQWSSRTIEWSRRNLYCYRNPRGIAVEVRRFNESIGRRIVDHSRIPVAEHINDFDVFLYTEDDMIMNFNMLAAWVNETNTLAYLTEGKEYPDKDRCGWKHPCSFSIGFLRYSRKHKYATGKFGTGI